MNNYPYSYNENGSGSYSVTGGDNKQQQDNMYLRFASSAQEKPPQQDTYLRFAEPDRDPQPAYNQQYSASVQETQPAYNQQYSAPVQETQPAYNQQYSAPVQETQPAYNRQYSAPVQETQPAYNTQQYGSPARAAQSFAMNKKIIIPIAVAAIAVIAAGLFFFVPPKAKSVSFENSEVSIIVNDTSQTGLTVTPARSVRREQSWDTTDARVAYVENGEIKASGEGECDIMVTIDGQSAKTHVTVIPEAKSIDISERDKNMVIGETRLADLKITPEAAAKADITFESSDNSVLTVEDGKFTALAEGDCDVKITVGHLSRTVGVKVLPKAESITLSEKSVEIYEKDTVQIEYTITPSRAQSRIPEFKSSNRSIATVSDDGVIKGIGSGECDITVTIDDKSQKLTVRVKSHVKSITLSENVLNMDIGAAKSLSCTIDPKDAKDVKVEWKSSDTKVAAVDGSGNVKAVGAGSATITATAEGKSDSCVVKVQSEEAKNAKNSVLGTWSATYIMDNDTQELTKLNGYESMLFIYEDGSCSMMLNYNRYTGSWYYSDDRDLEGYVFTFSGDSMIGLGKIETIGGKSGCLFVIFKDIDSSSDGYSMVYER